MKTLQYITLGLLIILSSSLMAQITITETHSDNQCTPPPNISYYYQFSGSIDISVSGGVPPYTYEWSFSNGGMIYSWLLEDEDIVDLRGGTYSVMVTDNSSNTEVLTVDIVNLNPPLLIDSLSQYSNFGWNYFYNNMGSCIIHASGGVAPYSYYVGATLLSDSLVTADHHSSIKVIDNVGCQQERYAILDSLEPNWYHARNGLCNGYIGFYSAFEFAPNEPIQYIWSNGETTNEINSVCPGSYSVTVTSPYRIDYIRSFGITPTFDNLYTFIDTLNASVETCILDNQASIDSAFIFDYHLVNSDSVITNWAIWDNGVADTINVGLNVINSGNNLVYLDVICNSKSMNEINTYSFYGMFNVTGVGIDKIEKEYVISIYPNPAKAYFTVSLNNSKESYMQILDITGKLIHQEHFSKEINISTEKLEKALYFVKVKNNDNIIIRKIIVE